MVPKLDIYVDTSNPSYTLWCTDQQQPTNQPYVNNDLNAMVSTLLVVGDISPSASSAYTTASNRRVVIFGSR
jgi:hypothetical protein